MKRIATFFIASLILSAGISSCKKCYTCNFGARGTQDLCSKDFPDGTAGLKLTVDAYEAQGYKCQAK